MSPPSFAIFYGTFKFVPPYCYIFFPMIVFHLSFFTTNKTVLVKDSTCVLNKYTKSGLYNNIRKPVNQGTTNSYVNPQDRLPPQPLPNKQLDGCQTALTRKFMHKRNVEIARQQSHLKPVLHLHWFWRESVFYVEITNLIKQGSLCTFFNHMKGQLV